MRQPNKLEPIFTHEFKIKMLNPFHFPHSESINEYLDVTIFYN